MRREELYLTDMVEAADAISQFVLGVEQDAFSKMISYVALSYKS